MKGNTNLVYVSVKELPSKFLNYPKGIEIGYTANTFGEVLDLNSSKLSKKNIFEYFLDSMHTKGMDKLDLTLPDFLYLSFLRKISTVGDDSFSGKFDCPHCSKSADYTISVYDVEFRDLEIPELPIVLDIESDRYVFTPFTVRDFFDLDRLVADELSEYKDEEILLVFAKQIRNKEFNKELVEKVKNATGDLLEAFKRVDSYLDHSLKPLNVACQHCHKGFKVVVDNLDSMVFPLCRTKDDVRLGISFGKGNEH